MLLTIHCLLSLGVCRTNPPPPPKKTKNKQDFSGFRLLVLLARERVMWPAPGQYETAQKKHHPKLGAPLDPLPMLMVRVEWGVLTKPHMCA